MDSREEEGDLPPLVIDITNIKPFSLVADGMRFAKKIWMHVQEASKMQILPQQKQQKIVENLIQIDRDLQQINIDRNENSVRQLIDHRRQLLANLRSLQPDNETPESSPGWLKYTPTIFSTELMQKWRSRVTLLKSEKQSFEDPDFCNQILDNILPEAWNFDSDVIVVSAPPSSTIALKAIDRKQRHIVIFDHHKSIDEDTFACHKTANVVICTTIKDVEIAFAKLQTPADQVITALLA